MSNLDLILVITVSAPAEYNPSALFEKPVLLPSALQAFLTLIVGSLFIVVAVRSTSKS